jgi:Zn-dependent protease
MVRGQGSPLFMWILKSLGISWHSAWARKYPESVRDWIIPAEELSEEAARGLLELRAQMMALGFESQALLGQHGSLYPMDSASEIFRHEGGRAIAVVTFVRNATLETRTVSFCSALADGKVFSTSNRGSFNHPPGFEGQEIRKATAAKLWDAHEARLATMSAAPVLIGDRDAALDLQQRIEQGTWDALIRRGIMVECSPEEVEKAQQRLEAVGGANGSAGRNPNAAVMLEMIHLTERKQTFRQIAWAFLITLALFIVAGLLRWETEFLWILVGALIVHEFGHYVTMRFFGYKNLRMIFVPLGGAAVIGSNYNIPGWKKAMVSLMGPLPGILFAAGCAVFALRGGPIEWRDKVALIALILNGLNLLPVFPLDGGAYLNAILFCRNAKLEIVFKAIAVVALAVSAFWFHDYLLGALAYFLAVGLRPSFRLARLTEQLRREVAIPAVHNPNELPVEVRNRVIEGVKASIRRPASAKTIAAQTLGIFERLNARPPGVAGTVVLLAVYAGTIAIAGLAWREIFAAKTRLNLGERPTPNLPWNCASAPVKVRSAAGADRVMAVSFEKANDVGRFVDAVNAAFPTNAPFVVAQTVFVPYARTNVRGLFPLVRKNHGRSVAQTGSRAAVVYWTFDAPTEEIATAIETDINWYLDVPRELHAFAPWAERTLDRLAIDGEREARQTLHALKLIERDFDDSSMTNEQRLKELLIGRIQSLVATNQNGLEMATVQWYTNYIAATNNLEFLRGPGREGAMRFGHAPRDDPARDLEMMPDAFVEVERRNVRVSSADFRRLEAGFAAFGNWLCAQGCSNIRYVMRME